MSNAVHIPQSQNLTKGESWVKMTYTSSSTNVARAQLRKKVRHYLGYQITGNVQARR